MLGDKETNYVLTAYGFRRVPLSPILGQQKRMISLSSSIKELQEKRSYVIYTNKLNRNELPPTSQESYLDRKWQQNLERMNEFIDFRPKSVPPQSTRKSDDDIFRCDNKKILNKRRVKSAGSLQLKKCPCIASNSNKLHHDDLTVGQRKYLWGTARCYSVQQLKKLTQRRMKCLLDYEFMKRYITASVPDQVKEKLWKEYCDYRVQIDRSAGKDITCMSCLPVRSQKRGQLRKASTPGLGQAVGTENNDELPKITNTDTNENLAETKEEAPARRIRPKSAKYQNRVGNASCERLSSQDSSSSLEDELVFAAEEKLSLFEKVLEDDIHEP